MTSWIIIAQNGDYCKGKIMMLSKEKKLIFLLLA